MHAFFDSDAWFPQLLNRFSSLVILNLLFLFTSIPIFTIGASLTALYDVVFRMDTEREGKTAAAYFYAFRENFRQSTPVWLLFLVVIAASCANAVIFSNMGSPLGSLLSLICVVILINVLMVIGYVFPLFSQFENSRSNTLKNALLLSIANLPRTLIITVINCFPWALIFMHLYTFVQLGVLWFTMYFAAAAYFNSRVLMRVFDPLRQPSSP